MAPPPSDRKAGDTVIKATDEFFSAFIFKIQANMNPAHRDRLAFARICSGKFIKGMNVYHVQGKKEIKLAQPQQLMAQDRVTVEEAFAGDIIGLFDPGIFNIGDTLTTGDKNIAFDPIPMFPSEIFCKVAAKDSMKRKQFIKGMNQLSEEGTVQIFKKIDIGIEELIVGAVGSLQFDVLEFRLLNEYGVQILRTTLPYRYLRWIKKLPVEYDRLNLPGSAMVARDLEERLVILFENEWSINWALEKNKGLELTDMI
jgi:peptide chain release factor 3